jgi:hypothetical protein
MHRNDNLDANSWENNKGGEDKAEFRRNQFGGSFGGPIKTDKAFFFGAYEGLRQARTGETTISDVLDENAHRGILPNGRTVQIAPSIKPYLDLWPLPNGPSNNDGSAKRFTAVDSHVNENYLVARADYRISDSQLIFSRFNYDNAEQRDPGGLGVLDVVTPSRQRFSTIQYENILTPTLLWNSSFAFNRTALNNEIEYNIDYPSSLFFMEHRYAPAFNVNAPAVGFSGGSQPSTRIQNKWELSQAFSYSIGNHTMKFGGSYSHVGFNNSGPAAGAFGSFTWANLEGFLTDQAMANLTAEVPNADTSRTVRQDIYGFYFQDDWRIRSNFTLNLGLRYEPWTSPTEKWGRVGTYRDWVTATRFSHPSTDGTDSYFNSPGESAFSPRVGLAWDVNGDGRTAIRAGVGIFNVMLLSPYLNTVTRKNPPDAGTLIQNTPGVNYADAPAYVRVRTPGVLSTATSADTFSEAIQFDLDPMYELKFNFSIEREITPDMSISLSYVGSRGTHLTMKSDWNARPAILVGGRPFVPTNTAANPWPRVNPNNGVITGTTSDAKSFYNAMNIEVKKRLSAGFQVQSVYTWSKNVDDSTTGLGNSDFGEGLVTQPYNHKADRGLAATQVGQNFGINGTWSLPAPASTGFASRILGGWQLTGILRASSGVPVGPTVRGSGGSGVAPDARRSANEQHPELLPGRTVESMTTGTFQGCAATINPSTGLPLAGYEPGQKLGTPDLYFDPCAFTRPAPGFYGNVGRNIILGPSFLNMDVSLMKSIPIGLSEGSRVQFNADWFNVANHPNFGRPAASILQANNGQVVTGAGQITSATSERQLQFGLKLIF